MTTSALPVNLEGDQSSYRTCHVNASRNRTAIHVVTVARRSTGLATEYSDYHDRRSEPPHVDFAVYAEHPGNDRGPRLNLY